MNAAEPPPGLPIDAVLPQVARALRHDRPIVVAASTGSGKSTRLPACMADALGGRVLVVEPRRVACRALAQWLSQEAGSRLGERIGYHVRFDRRVGPQTRIVFATPGMALALLASESDHTRGGPTRGGQTWAGVMLDEFHERSWELDLVLALARAGRFGSAARLVLCSATLDAEGLERGLNATTIRAEGRAYPIDISYRGEGPPRIEGLTTNVVAGVESALAASPGDCLVFLPGKREIASARAALQHVGTELVAVHGGLPLQALTKALAPAPHRRVFLATNVAETSLTIPSVTAVVDSGLVRRRLHRAGRSVLAIVPISAASMAQRAGRAGRVAPGICVRLWSARFAPELETPPEIERVELDEVILRAAMCGVAPRNFGHLQWLTAPPTFALSQAQSRLLDRGVVAHGGELTDAGRAQASLPVSALGARILGGAPKALVRDLAQLVGAMDLGRDLLCAGPTSGEVDEARSDLLANTVDEVDVLMTIVDRGDVKRHALNPSAVKEARSIAASLCRQAGGNAGAKPAPRTALVQHLLESIPDRVFVPRERSRRGQLGASAPWGNGEQELWVRAYAIPARDADLQPKPPVAGIVLDAEWLGSGQSARGVGGMVVRCSIAELVHARIGERLIGTPVLDRKTGRVTAVVTLTHAGVKLAARDETLEDSPLCEALADFILRGSLRKGLADDYLAAHHRWGLLAGWAAAKGDVAIDPPTTAALDLAATLVRQGVASSADLRLLERDDLLPPVESWAAHNGIGHRELGALVADFPRMFAFEGQRYACAVDFARRRVTLTPADSRTKKEPPAKVLPRFRGFAVVFVRASRTQQLR